MLKQPALLFATTLAFFASPDIVHGGDESPITPMRVLINGINPKDAKISPVDLFSEAFGEEKLTGFASLAQDNADTMGKPPTNSPGASECRAALEEKKRWHEEHNETFPDAFGKILNYEVHEVNRRRQLWAGRIETCTWYGNAEYYFDIRFFAEEHGHLRAVAKRKDENDPFPLTLNLDALPKKAREKIVKEMKKWDWKLHATGTAMKFVTAKKNGNNLPRSDALFKNPSKNCIDIFFQGGYPEDRRLPTDPFAMCMGRCDARVLNTP